MAWERVDDLATALLFLMMLVESLDQGFNTEAGELDPHSLRSHTLIGLQMQIGVLSKDTGTDRT